MQRRERGCNSKIHPLSMRSVGIHATVLRRKHTNIFPSGISNSLYFVNVCFVVYRITFCWKCYVNARIKYFSVLYTSIYTCTSRFCFIYHLLCEWVCAPRASACFSDTGKIVSSTTGKNYSKITTNKIPPLRCYKPTLQIAGAILTSCNSQTALVILRLTRKLILTHYAYSTASRRCSCNS